MPLLNFSEALGMKSLFRQFLLQRYHPMLSEKKSGQCCCTIREETAKYLVNSFLPPWRLEFRFILDSSKDADCVAHGLRQYYYSQPVCRMVSTGVASEVGKGGNVAAFLAQMGNLTCFICF